MCCRYALSGSAYTPAEPVALERQHRHWQGVDAWQLPPCTMLNQLHPCDNAANVQHVGTEVCIHACGCMSKVERAC